MRYTSSPSSTIAASSSLPAGALVSGVVVEVAAPSSLPAGALVSGVVVEVAASSSLPAGALVSGVVVEVAASSSPPPHAATADKHATATNRTAGWRVMVASLRPSPWCTKSSQSCEEAFGPAAADGGPTDAEYTSRPPPDSGTVWRSTFAARNRVVAPALGWPMRTPTDARQPHITPAR